MTHSTTTTAVAQAVRAYPTPNSGAPHTLTDESLFTRAAVAEALTFAGYPISAATLATKATRGGGPPYRLFGRRPLYEWGPALAWAQGRLSAPASSSSEHGARAA
jgi:hypothetical protein